MGGTGATHRRRRRRRRRMIWHPHPHHSPRSPQVVVLRRLVPVVVVRLLRVAMAAASIGGRPVRVPLLVLDQVPWLSQDIVHETRDRHHLLLLRKVEELRDEVKPKRRMMRLRRFNRSLLLLLPQEQSR